MRRPHCESSASTERRDRTELGYRRFQCRACHREFHERTGTGFNHLQYPTDVVCLVVLWRGSHKIWLPGLSGKGCGGGGGFSPEAGGGGEGARGPDGGGRW